MFHKVIRRPLIVFNLIFFNALVLVFFYVSKCLSEEISCFEPTSLIGFWESYQVQHYLLGLSVISTFFVFKISSKINLLYYASVLYPLGAALFTSYDKLTLLSLFTIAGFSFYFSVLWRRELEESYLNSNFDSWELNERRNEELKVTILQENQEAIRGVVANWSYQGCFVRFLNPGKKLKGKTVNMSIEFKGKVFNQTAIPIVVRRDGAGAGFSFSGKDSGKLYNWSHLYAILFDRSYLPEYLT